MRAEYSEELLSRVETWLSYSFSKRRTRDNVADLHQLYSLITGGSAQGCTNCNFSGYVGILEAYQRQSFRLLDPETVSNSSYTLAPGYEEQQFVHDAFDGVVTSENLTDKAAEFFIEKGFKHAFVKKIAPKAESEHSKPKTKADYQARYKELLGEDADDKLTIAQLTEAIDAKQAELDKQD
ncbi:hypothetical protein SAMN06265337_1918 [Hymenobacter gelipurpurascens]|uniref:Uncharacterized protein n=1 Tax=Hymenobacter gelipurpurascens TaxID=89968 RepID=A0A212TMW1_9BACT|nr:hypothetical protein [Hymenobacter gelipurpurascens]SNC67342.1 hypothetical protein SAMN06265337_1918 [Hymenobacter gelipurpurascens]